MRIPRDSSNSSVRAATVKIPVAALREYLEDWMLDAKLKGHTPKSIESREHRIGRFFWFLEYKGLSEVGTTELKEYVLYLQNGHNTPEGRWNNPKLREPMRPIMVGNYHRILKAFFNYLIEEELIEANPMCRVKVQNEKTEIKQPISNEDILKLLQAARKSETRKRDEAIILILLDTGMRASELCGLTCGDFDKNNLSLRVVGKGNKIRTVRISLRTYKALRAYLRGAERQDTPLFQARTGRALTGYTLYDVIRKLSKVAGIENPGCHAFRRSFAVNMLKNGAHAFAVQILMGHSDLTMTRRYCAVAEADLAEQHKNFSPVEGLKY